MQWKNNPRGYGLTAILFHWVTALTAIGLFGLGLYMVELDYYSPWYHRAPFIHKSLGLLLAGLFLLRLVWRVMDSVPAPLGRQRLLNLGASLMHWLFYLLLPLLFVSGYFIASADDKPVSVFDWFELPGWRLPVENQEDIAGEIHEILAWLLILLASVHALAALKHHFIDRDATLMRMLWPRK